ncbi:MAG TPA: ABC transporter permease [Christensenellaceae bacterium]|jgi:oligopeptide transport system permease protein|nr:ABC transporter permease [Christensenellaceae bacterium]
MQEARVIYNVDKHAVPFPEGSNELYIQALPGKPAFDFAEYHPEEAERTGSSEYSYWRSVWRNFVKKKSAVAMLVIFSLLFLFTFIAPIISKYDVHNLRIVDDLMFTRPNSTFWFGTDNLGRDYWSQVWYATRTSIILAVSVSAGQIIMGVLIGLVWGYVRSLDRFFTELYNFINNIPTIIYMTLIALMIGKSTLVMGLSMILFGWLGTARNIRNLVFMYRDREYNLASRCLGTSTWRILTRNIVPYLVSVIVLRLALAIPGTIAYETTLTYLGLMDISTPSLGILLRNARSFFLDYPYLLVFPAAIVSTITITFYLAGNAFSDACDPRNHL